MPTIECKSHNLRRPLGVLLITQLSNKMRYKSLPLFVKNIALPGDRRAGDSGGRALVITDHARVIYEVMNEIRRVITRRCGDGKVLVAAAVSVSVNVYPLLSPLAM